MKEFFQKVNFETNQQMTKSMKNYPVCNELIASLYVSYFFFSGYVFLTFLFSFSIDIFHLLK